MKERGKHEILEKTRRLAASFGTIPSCENGSEPTGDCTRFALVGARTGREIPLSATGSVGDDPPRHLLPKKIHSLPRRAPRSSRGMIDSGESWAGEMREPRESLPTSGIVRHDSHVRKSGSGPCREANSVRLGGRRVVCPLRHRGPFARRTRSIPHHDVATRREMRSQKCVLVSPVWPPHFSTLDDHPTLKAIGAWK
ncbi:hypothetical protein PR048_021473 [Dryococelus australis]|uniref:Uncharacterized protein n=1 Tax=Dryococelus australis TaxID=614101 RepID=A0ABQ9GYA4_9NEOP|nr:hypothetical protein PR048_021473 [Dryococelus australis]